MADIPTELSELAASYSEHDLRAAGGAKSTVAVGERHVFKVVEAGKESDAAHKERRVLRLLAGRLPERARTIVPQVLGEAVIEGIGAVEVHERLPGASPEALSHATCTDLAAFLRDLHDCASFSEITEFEGDSPRPFPSYLTESAAKFRAKLDGRVSPHDMRLVDGAVALVDGYAERAAARPPDLVVVHKDLSLVNLLVSGDRLTGVVDWGAAQVAPREWEMAIVAQRLGEAGCAVQAAYGHPLEPELIRVCGALQAIRFWKSFVHDTEFVEQQRALLRRVL